MTAQKIEGPDVVDDQGETVNEVRLVGPAGGRPAAARAAQR